MDLRGNCNLEQETKKIEWNDAPFVVLPCRPYLVGYSTSQIEIKNVFAPNKVVQKTVLLQTTISCHAVARNDIGSQRMDSVFLLLSRQDASDIKVLFRMT